MEEVEVPEPKVAEPALLEAPVEAAATAPPPSNIDPKLGMPFTNHNLLSFSCEFLMDTIVCIDLRYTIKLFPHADKTTLSVNNTIPSIHPL